MAGRIPQDFLDQLLSRTDIVELIDSRVSLRKTGQNYSACCPFHNEKTASFTVSSTKQFYHCFGCGVHGNAISFLMDYERLEFPDAVAELAQHAGMEIPREQQQYSSPDHSQLYHIVQLADRFFRRQLREHPEKHRAIDYLRARGLDGRTAKQFGIGFAPPGWDNLTSSLTTGVTGATTLLLRAGLVVEKQQSHNAVYDRFRDRIMFPIRDRRGRTIAFGGRAFADVTPKYLNSPESPIFHKGQELYGLFEARQSSRQLLRLLVVEGYMDVVALAQHGINYVVATLGTATTQEHLEKLFRSCSEIIFCYDGDNAGREAAWRALTTALPLLRDGRLAKFLFLPEGEDPDSLVRQEGQHNFEQRLLTAQPLSEYFFQRLGAAIDSSSFEGRAQLNDKARPLLQQLPAGTFREQMILALAQRTGVKQTALSPPEATPAQGLKQQQARQKQPLSLALMAIKLLLYDPKLCLGIDDIGVLSSIADADNKLFLELVEFIQHQPHISTGNLLERFRGHAAEARLNQLAKWQPQSTDIALEAEFSGVVSRLREQAQKRLYDRLLTASPRDLSTEERQALRQNKRLT